MDTKPNLMKRLKRRLGSRGVAMVEGAVVFPVMVGFMVMLELSHHSFDAYMTAGHVARERAWSAATTGSLIGNCTEARDDQGYVSKLKYFTIPGAAGTGEPAGPAPNPDTKGKVSVPGDLPGSKGFFKYTAEATAPVTVKRGGRTFTNTPKSKVTVYCNQKFYGTIVDMIKSAFHK